MDVGASAIAETPIYKILLDSNVARLNAFEYGAFFCKRKKFFLLGSIEKTLLPNSLKNLE
jgi:hypothetical protein